MTPDAERLARVRLSRVLEPGEPVSTALAAEVGGERLLASYLGERGDEHEVERARRLAACDPAVELERAAGQGIRFVVPQDEEWPSALDDLAHVEDLQGRGGVPIGLWVAGPLRLDRLGERVAVVGSRSATTYGAQVAADIAASCVRSGLCVVSGAAFGIDQAAHRGALAAGGTTVAVLACGVDRAYPVAHKSLLDHLAATSAVISEAAPGCSPTRVRFLSRNRIIAALGAGTVVVEAAIRSGALNTANWAERLGRQVMGVPGPVTSAASGGVHHLVRRGAATLVTGGPDVLELVGAAGEHLLSEPRAPERPRDRLNDVHRLILEAVPVHQPAGSDAIARTAALSIRETRRGLERLRRLTLVQEVPGGWRLTQEALA